jgi:hypothetical protein
MALRSLGINIMAYTISQLKDGICLALGYKAGVDGTKTQFIQAKLAELQVGYDDKIAKIETPKEYLKKIGINYLLEKEKEDSLLLEL